MRFKGFIASAALAALLMGAPAGARADDIRTVARAVATKSAGAIVTVKLVVKIKMGGREQEQKLEATGTVIDASGLTMVSASAADPTSMLGALSRRGRGGGGGEMPRIESEVSETIILLEDGTEIEADVVLKDADLDVAFVRPREAQTLAAVELKARGKGPAILEDVFVVSRLGRGDSRAIAVETGSVKAVVKGPRTYYVCTSEVSGSQGCLAYGADGAPLGIFVMKVNADAGEGGGRGGRGGMASIVMRPIDDILEIAKQAKDAKAPEKKAAPEPKEGDAEPKADAPKAPTASATPAAPK